MLMSKLKALLQQKGSANLLELKIQLHTEPDVVRAMLAHWIGKGYVQKQENGVNCGDTCSKCSPLMRETYRWVF